MKKLSLPQIALFGLMAILTAASMDIYLPSIEQIVSAFATNYGTAQLTISMFMFGFAAAQLVFGPLSDHYGRRPILFGGLIIYIISTIACIFAPSIHALIIARFFQAAGSCSTVITAYAMGRDLFDKNESTKLYAFLGASISLAPVCAPIIGSFLIQFWGWKSNFVVLMGTGIIILISTYFGLSETVNRKPGNPAFKKLVKDYVDIFLDNQFLRYWICVSAAFTAVFSFIASSPELLMGNLGLSVHQYSYAFASNACALLVGSWITSRLTDKIGADKTLLFGGIILLIGAILMLGAAALLPFNVFTLMIPMIIASLGNMLAMPTAMSGLMENYQEKAGAASALASSLRFIVGALVAAGVSYINQHEQWPLAITILGCALAILIFKPQTKV